MKLTVARPMASRINPNAADPARRCPDAQARVDTEEDATAPEPLRSAPSRPKAPPAWADSRLRLPRSTPTPATATASSWSANGFAAHVKLSGLDHPRPAGRAS